MRAAVLMVALLTPLAAIPARGEAAREAEACGPHDRLEAHLAARWGERLAGRGVTSDGYLVEIVVNRDTQTWTLLLTKPEGATCAVAAGQGWDSFLAVQPGEDL